MKVLFAVNNEKVSEAIIKKYQTMYKEIISWKNVYFFNAIIKELQKDKSYDRIIIGEDLEPYTNNNYEVIDNFLFDKLDNISDEASNSTEGDIPIILIATDRREKGSNILVKLFGIGIYNVLLGKDRSIENVCKLIAQPRTKKEAKAYYKIESDDVDYQAVDPDDVSESEIQNIIRHYKKLGKNEEKYVESFDNIAEQYTDTQLKLITKFLPLNVRAVLEEKSPKYQQVMIGSVKGQIDYEKKKALNQYTSKYTPRNVENKIELIDKELQKSKLTKPVVIPHSIDMQRVKKVYTNTKKDEETIKTISEENTDKLNNIEEQLENILQENTTNNVTQAVQQEKRGRGRPKKEKTPEQLVEEAAKAKRGRGRPKKVVEPQNETENQDIDLFNLVEGNNDEDTTPELITDNVKEINQIFPELDNTILPGLEEETILPGFEEEQTVLPGLETETMLPGLEEQDITKADNMQSQEYSNINTQIERTNISYNYESNISNLLTSDKKIAAFVGTSKNGTSFLVNNLAVQLSNKGINTAILDLTRNQNSYYIYTLNEDELREKAFRSVEQLRTGVADGIKVNRNLTVYTSLPGENEGLNDFGNILETLLKNHSLILLDCDFETNLNYFNQAQELYLVQTYDILTIQPLTQFLNELKHRNILDTNKLRIVLNKTLKLRKLTDKNIIGGISCFNDPASTFINTLFDKDTVRYTTIPFENDTYARYLERLVDCEISLNGYSKNFLEALNKLSDMVYPLIAGKNNYQANRNYNEYNKNRSTFSSNMDATLNKMRNKF